MSKIKSTQCPSCGEFVPDNTIKVTTKDGKKYHEGCAKEIASLYLALSMKSGNIKPKAGKKSGKNKRTPQKTQQVKMIVKQILAHNFVTYESLNIRFPEYGIIGIEGNNMDKPSLDTNAAGKTLIFDMISYALYGEVLRKKSANIIGPFAKEMILSVAFWLPATEKTMIVKRERRGPNEVVKIKMDGKMYEGRPRKMQPMIDELLGIEWLTFQNCILYGESRESNFVYVGHSKRTEILAQIANVLHLREARKLISPDLKEAEKDLAYIKGRIETLRETRLKAKETLEQHLNRFDNLEEEYRRISKGIDDEIKEVSALYCEIDSDIIKKNMEDLEFSIGEMEYRLARYNADVEELEALNPVDRLQSLTTKRTRIETIINQKKKEWEALKDLNECPTCYGEVDDTTKDKILMDVPAPPTDIIKEIKELQKIVDKIKNLKEVIESVKESLKERANKRMEYQKDLATKEVLRKEIIALTDKKARQEDIKNEVERNIEISREEYDSLTTQFSTVTFKKKGIMINRDVLKYWSDKFSPKGAEAELIVDLLEKLQSFANKYIHTLTDGSISIYIRAEKETTSGTKQEIGIEIIENGEIKDFDLYSGGQRNRIEKAIRLGLMKVLSNDVGFKLFDEIGKDLSPKGYEDTVKLMRDIFHEQQIFLVTNDRETKKLFDHRMIVTMRDGKSEVQCSWKGNEDAKEEESIR